MRDRIRAFILLSISLVAAATLFALGRSLFADDPGTLYDLNANGMIEGYEAVWAVRGYYEGDITQEQAVDLFLRYFGTVPIATPAPARAPTATATMVSNCDRYSHTEANGYGQTNGDCTAYQNPRTYVNASPEPSVMRLPEQRDCGLQTACHRTDSSTHGSLLRQSGRGYLDVRLRSGR